MTSPFKEWVYESTGNIQSVKYWDADKNYICQRTEWYENGQKMSNKYYDVNECCTGHWERWYENGQKRYYQHYDDGKIVVSWIEWDENGVVSLNE